MCPEPDRYVPGPELQPHICSRRFGWPDGCSLRPTPQCLLIAYQPHNRRPCLQKLRPKRLQIPSIPHLQQTIRLARGVPYVRATVSPDSIEATQPSPVSAASAPKAPSDSVQATLLDMPSEGSCPGSPPPSLHARAQQSFRLLSHATARTPARPGASIDIDRLSARIWQIQTLSSVPIPYPVARLAAMRNIDSFNNALQHALDLLAFPSPASQSSHWPSPLIAERPSNFSHAHHYALEG